MTDQYLNQKQLAERWLMSESSLERWRSEGFGPRYLKLRGRVLYRIADIEVFEEERSRRSTAESAVGRGSA